MQRVLSGYGQIAQWLAGRWIEGGALLLTRFALAGVFWRSGRTKVVDGSWFAIDDAQYYLFEEFGLPVSPEIMVPVTAFAELTLPVFVALGLLTRFAALALLGMTLVIQLFVFPEAWWPTHSLWAAMALVLVSRGGGLFSFDAVLTRGRK